MHVLVATDGHLDPDLVARFAPPLAGPDGTITVLTVVEIPRRMLDEIRTLYGERSQVIVDRDAEVGTGIVPPSEPVHWPGDDAILSRYLNQKRDELTGPIVERLQDSGASVSGVAIEGEEPAREIVDYMKANDVDVVLIGSRGRGFFEGLLGRTGIKLTRVSPKPVLVLRTENG